MPSAEAKSLYFSVAEMSVAEMSIGRNVRGRNVLAETSVAEMSVAEMSEHFCFSHSHACFCLENRDILLVMQRSAYADAYLICSFVFRIYKMCLQQKSALISMRFADAYLICAFDFSFTRGSRKYTEQPPPLRVRPKAIQSVYEGLDARTVTLVMSHFFRNSYHLP